MTDTKKPGPSDETRLEGARVLVVEDDEDILRMLALVVDSAGGAAETARSGTEACRRLESGAFEALVLDWNLADVAGPDLLAKIRADFPDLIERTLVVTGDLVREGANHEAMRLGCRVLAKPFRPRKLVEAIAALLD